MAPAIALGGVGLSESVSLPSPRHWEGFNSGAGYYVYTFIPTGTASQSTLKTSGSLNVDAKPFLTWLQNNRAKGGRCNNSMYLHAAEAGFEVVRGNGWAKVSATMDAK